MTTDPHLNLAQFRQQPQKTMAWILQRLTGPWRSGPDFLIPGVQKGGTSSLFAYLAQHPGIQPPIRKEIKYFDIFYFLGDTWYKGHFPLRHRLQQHSKITGEGTPNSLFHPSALHRAARSFPQTRIILLLRNPVDRAFSHYHNQKRVGHEPLSFEDAVAAEEARLAGEAAKISADPRYSQGNYINFSYLASGRYIEQIPRVFEAFPAKNILILKSEDFYQHTSRVFLQTLEFLGLPAWEPPAYAVVKEGKYTPMEGKTRRQLQAYFRPYNQALNDYLKRDFGWDDPATGTSA